MSTCNESSGLDDESSTSTRTFNRGVPSFLEPRDPSIINPWMRPRPTHGTNLCNLFEEDSYCLNSQPLEQQHLKVYLRIKPVNIDFSNTYQIENETDLKTAHSLIAGKNKTTWKDSVIYKFTHIFNKCNQVTVFNKLIKTNLKEYIFNGNDFTLMTYGASGSGKTYSLMGLPTQPGVIPRCLEFLFQQVHMDEHPKYKPDDRDHLIALDTSQQNHEMKSIQNIVKKCKDTIHEATNLKQYRRMSTALSRASQEWKRANEEQLSNTHCEVWVSFAEIYNELIYDLLDETNSKDAPTRLKLVQPPDQKPYIKGLKWVSVRSGIEAFSVLTRGRGRLRYANTNVNATSSRSHCIFTMKLVIYYKDTNTSKISTFRLCDLAGLERAKMTENRGERLNESKRINSSLHVLEKCLLALKSKQHGQHMLPPYRESKLTALLQNALAGKENISMLVTINPETKFFDETQHVLKFSALAQELLVDVQKKSELQMSRHYSDISKRGNSSISLEDINRLLEEIKRREDEVEQRELDIDDREAELERLQAEEQWEERERQIRAEVAGKFIGIQEKIYKDCDIRIEQEKKILGEEHNIQINRWTQHSSQLEDEVRKLQKENEYLKNKVNELQTMLDKFNTFNNTTKVSQSCNTDILDVTELYDSVGNKISGIIPHLSIKDEKYDDFLKDFNRINISKDGSLDEKLANSTENKTFQKMESQNNTINPETSVKNDSSETIPHTNNIENHNETCTDTLNTTPIKKDATSLLCDETNSSPCHVENNVTNKNTSVKINEKLDNSSRSETHKLSCSPEICDEPESGIFNSEKEQNAIQTNILDCSGISGLCNLTANISEKENCVDGDIRKSVEKDIHIIDTVVKDLETKNNSCLEIANQNVENIDQDVLKSDSDNLSEKETSLEDGDGKSVDKEKHNIETVVKDLETKNNSYKDIGNQSAENSDQNILSKSDSDNNRRALRSRKAKVNESQINHTKCTEDKTNNNENIKENNENTGRVTRKQLKLCKTKSSSEITSDDNKTPSPIVEKTVDIENKELVNGDISSESEMNLKNSNVLKDKIENVNCNQNKGLPLPDCYYTIKKDKLQETMKENMQGLCLSSRRKLFSRRQMDEIAAEPQAHPQSARCLFFELKENSYSPDPNKPPEVPKLYTYNKPTRTRQRKK